MARVAQLYLIEKLKDVTGEILLEVGRFGPQGIVRLAASLKDRLGQPSKRTTATDDGKLNEGALLSGETAPIWDHGDGGAFISLAEDKGWLKIATSNQVTDGVDDF